MTSHALSHPKDSQSGFSVIELLIAIFFASVALVVFYQLFSTTTEASNDAQRFAKASDIAYGNLQKFTKKPPSMPVCGTSGLPMTLLSTSSTIEPLGPKVVQAVVATYAFPCSQPVNVVKIESTVTYRGIKVSHASFVN